MFTEARFINSKVRVNFGEIIDVLVKLIDWWNNSNLSVKCT